MKERGLFSAVNDEVGEIIVADVSKERIAQLLENGTARGRPCPGRGCRS
jgi:hypothetical protein